MLLLIVLIGILIVPLAGTSYRNIFYSLPNLQSLVRNDTSKISESKKWEYIKARLFPLGGNIVPKFKGPILISLENASEEQRVLVKEIIGEIQELIPNKSINLFKDHTGFTSQEVIDSVSNSSVLNDLFDLYINSISITFGEKRSPNTDYIEPRGGFPRFNTSILSDSTVIKRNNTSSINIKKEIEGAILAFNFSKRTNVQQQKKYIKYELLRSLCYIPRPDDYNTFERAFFRGYFAFRSGFESNRDVFNSFEYDPENYEITPYDQFLLKKLYSNDFQTQFKNYLTQYYPKLYVYNFYYKAKVKLISEILVIVLGAFLFILSLSILHKKRFKFGLFKYLLPILLINISLLALLDLKRYLQLEFSPFMYRRVFTFTFIFTIIFITVIQSLSLWLTEYFILKKVKSFVLNLILKVILTFSCFIIPYIFFSVYSRVYLQNFLIISLVIAISRGLYIYLNHYSDSLVKQKDIELSQLKELQAATELNSLHAQINPHFLYNSLNSIASLAHVSADKTEKMALSLSDLFKYSINRKGKKLTTIKEEVEMVENYLQIEKIRFEDRLEFSVEVDTDLLETKIPRFILQPIIENAVKHGIAKIEGKGYIHLQISKDNKDLIISVSDNGPDFPDGLVSGHGLQSIYDLLRLSYGDQASINWENLPKKKITITINYN